VNSSIGPTGPIRLSIGDSGDQPRLKPKVGRLSTNQRSLVNAYDDLYQKRR
jgi:hypothetical protein